MQSPTWIQTDHCEEGLELTGSNRGHINLLRSCGTHIVEFQYSRVGKGGGVVVVETHLLRVVVALVTKVIPISL